MTPNELFEQYQSLVPYIFQKRFSTNPLYQSHRDDLQQEGLIALWKACTSYKENPETTFGTYAYVCIYRRMLGYAERNIYPQDSKSVSLEIVVSEDTDGNQLRMCDCLMDAENVEDHITVQETITEVLAHNSPLLGKIVRLVLAGYSQECIADHLGVAQCTVSRGWRKFQKEFKKYYIGGKE